jgi:hypothetical protein
MKLIRILVASALMSVLASCQNGSGTLFDAVSTVSTASIPAQPAVAAIQAFDGVQVLAASYVSLRRCTATNRPICREAGATQIIRGAANSGRIARNEVKRQLRLACAQEFAQGAPCFKGIPVASYNTLIAASKTINDATAAYRAATGG